MARSKSADVLAQHIGAPEFGKLSTIALLSSDSIAARESGAASDCRSLSTLARMLLPGRAHSLNV